MSETGTMAATHASIAADLDGAGGAGAGGADLDGGAGAGGADLAGGGAWSAARLRRERRKAPSMPPAFALVAACEVSGAICRVRALHNSCDRPHS